MSLQRRKKFQNLPRFHIGDERWLLDSQGPKTFYYLDETQINDLYSQIKQTPLLQEYSERETSSKGLEGGVSNAPIVFSGRKGQEMEKTSRFVANDSIVSKYAIIEDYLKSNGLIDYGIARFQTDEQQRLKFFESCDSLEKEFKYRISEEERNKHWITLNKENSYPTLERIKLVSGNVVIREDFSIKEANGDITLLFQHPVNEYLEDKDKGVMIYISCSKDKLTSSGTTFLVAGKTIKATCIGKVIRWDEQSKMLEINPIAVF